MIATWIALLCNPAAAGELREPLLELLNAYERGATAKDLAELGDGVPAELMEIAADPEVPHSRRGRAVSALGHFPAPEVRTFLDQQLAGDDSYLQRKATHSLVVAFADDALPSLEPALTHDDVQLRLAAVHAVAELDTDPARAMLRKRMKKERDDTVKSALESALAKGASK